MNANAAADIHADARPGVDPVQAGLGSAPHAQARRPVLPHRPGEGRGAVEEQVAALEADHPALGIEVEVGEPEDRRLVQAAFGKQGKGAAAAPLIERVAPLEGHGDGQPRHRLVAHAGRHLGITHAANRRAGAQSRGQRRRELVGQAGADLAAAKRAAGGEIAGSRTAAQQRPGRQLQPVEPFGGRRCCPRTGNCVRGRRRGANARRGRGEARAWLRLGGLGTVIEGLGRRRDLAPAGGPDRPRRRARHAGGHRIIIRDGNRPGKGGIAGIGRMPRVIRIGRVGRIGPAGHRAGGRHRQRRRRELRFGDCRRYRRGCRLGDRREPGGAGNQAKADGANAGPGQHGNAKEADRRAHAAVSSTGKI